MVAQPFAGSSRLPRLESLERERRGLPAAVELVQESRLCRTLALESIDLKALSNAESKGVRESSKDRIDFENGQNAHGGASA